MKTNKKLLASAMALGLAGLTTVGSTYAWFTANGTASVGGVEMTAKSDTGGIFIANEGDVSWNDTLSFATDFTGKDFVPCTTADGKTFYKLNGLKDGKKAFSYTQLPGEEDGSKVYYVEKKLHIALSSDPINVSVKASSFTFDGTNKVIPVARLSITTSAETVIYGFGSANRESTDVALKAYNKLYTATVGENESKSKATGLMGANGQPIDETVSGTSTSDADLFNVTKDITSTAYTLTNSLFKQFSDSGISNSSLNLSTIDQLGTYNYTTITLRFWFEGNDYNCYNAVSTSKVSFGLTFARAD